jgi:phosphate transport system substrate-binding protein
VLSQQGQETVVKDGYVPLPANMAAKVLADLAR